MKLAAPHRVTYRPGPGIVVRLEVPARVDCFDLLDWTQKRLFPDVTEEQRKADVKRADEIMRKHREAARALDELNRERRAA